MLTISTIATLMIVVLWSSLEASQVFDQIIDSIVHQGTDAKHKTYEDAIKDSTSEDEEETQTGKKKKDIYGSLYLKDDTVIKNVRCKDREFTFTKGGQRLKIPKEKALIIDFSKEKDKDILYLTEISQITKGTVNELETVLRLEDTAKNKKYVAVKMSCPWEPCRIYEPVFKEMAEEYKAIAFCKVILQKAYKERKDKEEEKIVDKYKISFMPTTILFKDGKEVYRKTSADLKKEDLKTLISTYLK
jgi:thiol-disulfide isomerase/thioredoxin